MIESIYEISYKVWNTLIGLAITLFTTSPKSASGGALYSTAHTLYLAIEAIALPICSLFFLIAIIRDVMQAPDGQKQKKMIWDMVKFGVIVLICGTLWELTGAVFDITDNITDVMAANSDISEDSSSYELDVSDELKTAISDFEDTNPEFEVAHPFQSISDKVDYFSEWIIFLICAISTLFITVSSCISILSSGFQRIIKPLVIVPFAAIAFAMASGTDKTEQVMWNYVKTLIGLCLGGAVMVVCVKYGASLSHALITEDLLSGAGESEAFDKMLFYSIQNAITPIVTAGLVKGTDSLIQRFL